MITFLWLWLLVASAFQKVQSETERLNMETLGYLCTSRRRRCSSISWWQAVGTRSFQVKTVDCAAQTHRQLPPLLCLCWWFSFGTRNSTETAERNRRPAGNTGLIWCNAETGSQSCNRKGRSHTTTDTPQGIKIRHFL